MRDAGRTVMLICGGLFVLIGTVFLGLGVWMFGNMEFVYSHGTGNVAMLPYVFCGMAVVLLVVGWGLLISVFWKARRIKSLVEGGHYLMADIVGVVPDFGIQFNGCPTYRVECRYYDSRTGTLHCFYSKNLFKNLGDFLNQSQVRVYVRPGDNKYRVYYVDIDPVLPNGLIDHERWG